MRRNYFNYLFPITCAMLTVIAVIGKSTPSYGSIPAVENKQETTKRKIVVKNETGQLEIGVVVSIKGTNKAAVTSINGDAYLEANIGDVLKISYMGYRTVEITVGAASGYEVTLEVDALNIDEVVVVGYGSQKKANLTGAVSQVKMSEVLGDRPVTSVSNALQGAIPGLVISGGASPNSDKTFNIRGFTSINGGSPLVLIDNVPGDINNINPEDIESVSVLKDASSAAIYGARGAFGVILITTKRATSGTRSQITYNNNFGFQNTLNQTNDASIDQILSSYQDAQFSGDKFVTGQDIPQWRELLSLSNSELNQRGQYYGSHNDIYVLNGDDVNDVTKRYYLTENNQWDNMQQDFGFQQSHNLSASGGSEKISYRLSMGYVEQDGVLVTNKDSYNRINLSSYVNAEITDWLSTSIDIKYAKIDKSDPYLLSSGGDIWNTNKTNFIPRGMIPFNGQEYYSGTPENLLLTAPVKNTIIENPRIYSRTSITPFDGFEAILEYTYDGRFTDFKQDNMGPAFITTTGTLDNANTTTQYWNNRTNYHYNSLNAYASYNKSVKRHNMKLMAGFTQDMQDTYVLNTNRLDMINPDLPSLSGGTGITIATDSFTENIIRGGYFRFNYDFDDKYLLEVNGRYDGSSKFPTANRYGFFPSASVGWQVTKEDFMSWSESWLDQLKLRASFGQIGNQNIAEYGYVGEMNSSALAGWVVNGKRPIMTQAPGLVRANYTWETVETLNIGVDYAFLNNRLQGSFEWYRRDTKDMLIPGSTYPATVGASAPKQNAADLRTKGWELSLRWRDNIGDVGYSIGANIFDSRSIITSFKDETGLIKDNYVGKEMGSIWGYESDGYYSIEDFVSSSAGVKGWEDNIWTLNEGITSIKGVSVRPGDMKFVNQSDYQGSTNRIDAGTETLENPGDRIIIGNNRSRYEYGVSASVNYKGFSLSALLNGVGSREVYTKDALRFGWAGGQFGTIYADQLDYWQPIDAAAGNYQPINPNAEFPRIYDKNSAATSNKREQTKYLMNGAYLRVKNVTFGYTLSKSVVQKMGLQNARVFVSGENLFTFDSLPEGYDPERVNSGYPFYRTFSLGLSVTL